MAKRGHPPALLKGPVRSDAYPLLQTADTHFFSCFFFEKKNTVSRVKKPPFLVEGRHDTQQKEGRVLGVRGILVAREAMARI